MSEHDLVDCEKHRVKIRFPLEIDDEGYPPVAEESLWAEPCEGGLFRVLNIPFYARDLAWGDTVRADETEEGLVFAERVTPSGHATIRVIGMEEGFEEVLKGILAAGNLDWESMGRLYAIDCPEEAYEALVEALDVHCETGLLDYEVSA